MIDAMLVGQIDGILVGPTAALALAIVGLGLFYKGKILARNTVPREDLEASQAVNASYAEGMRTLTKSVDELVALAKSQQQNGRHDARH